MKNYRIGSSEIFITLKRQARKHFSWPSVGRVKLGDLDRVRPISGDWGFSRGQPVDRHFIESFLSSHAADIRGRVLEVKHSNYTLRFGGNRVTRSDILHKGTDNPAATIVADLADGDAIPSGVFDCVICTQTLNLIYDVPAAVKTLHRILRPGGVLLATVPAISRINPEVMGQFQDYWRFTTASRKRLFEARFGSENLQTAAYGNVYAAVAFLHGLSIEDLDVQKLEDLDPSIEVIIALRATKESDE